VHPVHLGRAAAAGRARDLHARHTRAAEQAQGARGGGAVDRRWYRRGRPGCRPLRRARCSIRRRRARPTEGSTAMKTATILARALVYGGILTVAIAVVG